MTYFNGVMPSEIEIKADNKVKAAQTLFFRYLFILFCLFVSQSVIAADLLVIRHAEATNNTHAFYSTNVNNPGYRRSFLTAEGQVQVRRMARELRRKGYNHRTVGCIVYSPLPRTHQTAVLLASELGVSANKLRSDHRIQDTNVGLLDGKSSKNIPKDIDRWFEQQHSVEKKEEVIFRMMDVHDEFARQGKNAGHIMLITHYRPASLLLQKVKGKKMAMRRGSYEVINNINNFEQF